MFPRSRTREPRLPWLISLASLVSFAAQAAPLGFTTALDLAERQSSALAASAAQREEARLAARPAGALPDPKVIFGIENFPVSGPDAGRLQADAMTMQKIGLMQDVPNADKRQSREEVAAAEVERAHSRYQVARLAVRRDAALAWLDVYYLQRKEALFDALDRENAILANAIQAQIAGGRGQSADVIAPKQEAVQLADRRDDLARDIARAQSRLRQLVGADVDAGLAGEPPALEVDVQQLRQSLHQHPELRAFAAETRKAEAEVREAQSMKTPDWGIELAYQRRAPEFGNMVSLQFSLDLPVSPSTRQNPLIAARQQALLRIDAERDGMLREHTNELEGMLAEVDALTRQLARARQIALPLAEQKLALQTASYQAGKSDLSAVLAARKERIEQRMRVIELEAQRAGVAARLRFAYEEGEQ